VANRALEHAAEPDLVVDLHSQMICNVTGLSLMNEQRRSRGPRA
jgi:hypothetical protein